MEILPELEIEPMPVWLATHRGLIDSKRIRLVFDELADGIRLYLSGQSSVDGRSAASKDGF